MALATLGLTIGSHGKLYAAVEARSMIAGAAGVFLYAVACVYFIGVRHAKATPTAVALLAVWAIGAFGVWAVWLRQLP